MKKAKKFLLNLLAFASVSAFALGVAACDDTGAQGAKGDKGETGEQGVGIECVQVDENGNLVITLTDGTVLPAIEFPANEPIENGATHYLQYQKIVGKDEYRLIGLGLAAESDIVISSTYNGLPVTEIAESTFEDVSHISSVIIPDTITTIGNKAFHNCDGLTNVTIPNSVTTIGYDAFYHCEKLESITIGNSVTTIGYRAFPNCNNLTSVYYAGDIAGWCAIEFDGCYATPLINGADLYINNEKIVDLVIPDGVETVNDYAFYDCDGLTSVTIGASVKIIGSESFYDCDGLTSITIVNSVTRIGVGAFESCNNLINITIPDSVTHIGLMAFSDCPNLRNVIFEDTSTWYYYWEKPENRTQLNANELSDVETAAELLKRYSDYFWYKL